MKSVEGAGVPSVRLTHELDVKFRSVSRNISLLILVFTGFCLTREMQKESFSSPWKGVGLSQFLPLLKKESSLNQLGIRSVDLMKDFKRQWVELLCFY